MIRPMCDFCLQEHDLQPRCPIAENSWLPAKDAETYADFPFDEWAAYQNARAAWVEQRYRTDRLHGVIR